MGMIVNKGILLGKCQLCLGVRCKLVQRFVMEGLEIEGRKVGWNGLRSTSVGM